MLYDNIEFKKGRLSSVGVAPGMSLKEWGHFLEKEIEYTKFNRQEVLHCWFDNGRDTWQKWQAASGN